MNWETFLTEEIDKSYFKELADKIKEARKNTVVYPKHDDTFRIFENIAAEDVRVVILGQDPYHGENQANGLAFSVDNWEIPPSLRNIFIEVRDDCGMTHIKSGDLMPWVDQGVLLMNCILTVEADKPGSHANIGWERFTDTIISQLSKYTEHLVFMLWGNFAKSKKNLIDESKHLILQASHPSPLSAHRGFFGCKHFTKANSYLKEYGKGEIIW